MKYSRFEELPVWKDAIELAVRIFELTARPVFRRYRSVRDQLERASMSISNNIAEGFERGTTQETLTFLYISRGSAGETRSVLCLCERLPELSDLRCEISDLKSKAESISRQLRRWADSLQKFRHSRPTVSDGQNQKQNKGSSRARRVPGRATESA